MHIDVEAARKEVAGAQWPAHRARLLEVQRGLNDVAKKWAADYPLHRRVAWVGRAITFGSLTAGVYLITVFGLSEKWQLQAIGWLGGYMNLHVGAKHFFRTESMWHLFLETGATVQRAKREVEVKLEELKGLVGESQT